MQFVQPRSQTMNTGGVETSFVGEYALKRLYACIMFYYTIYTYITNA